MLERWAEHLTKGASKYPDLPDGNANWTLADGLEELNRFRESAFRHFYQWVRGDVDEDHAAAVFFNINGAEYVKEKMNSSEEIRRAFEQQWREARTPEQKMSERQKEAPFLRSKPPGDDLPSNVNRGCGGDTWP